MNDMSVVKKVKKYKPDFTAWFVLQGSIAAMHRPAFYNTENEDTLKLAKVLAHEAGKTRLLSNIIYRLPYSWQYKIGEFVTISGRLRHFHLRKKEIEKQARKLLADSGIKQIIVLGAGLDVLALRLAREFHDIKFIEIDLAASQTFKTESLALHNIEISKNIEFIAGDLRNPLSEILAQSKSYDSSLKSLWIAEGVFMFIPEENVSKIFKQLKQASVTESYSIFTTLGSSGQGTAISRIIQKLYLKKEKCPFHWVVPFEKLPEFVLKLNFEVVEQISCVMLHKGHTRNKSLINHDIGDDIHIVKI